MGIQLEHPEVEAAPATCYEPFDVEYCRGLMR